MKVILRIVIIVLAILSLGYIVPGISVDGWYAALIVAVILGLLNIIVKPIVTVITLPLNMLTLGLFGLVVNGVFLWFIGSFVQGFEVASFLAAFLGALFITVINWVVSKI